MYGGNDNDYVVGGTAANALLFGGFGDDLIIGASGPGVLVGGPGDDQLYSGSSGDIMIGGKGADYFDCGTSGTGEVLDFNPAQGDTKASNCKYVFTPSETPAAP